MRPVNTMPARDSNESAVPTGYLECMGKRPEVKWPRPLRGPFEADARTNRLPARGGVEDRK